MSMSVKKEERSERIEEMTEECACYVLITCTQPNAKGEMQVEMTYDGDEALASYLIESAKHIINDD